MMFRFKFAGGFALAMLTALALAGPAAAGDQVPFHGAFAGPYTVTPVPGTPTANLVVTGAGLANHLGVCEIEIPHLVNFATMSATGTYRMTAANGDVVDASFTGQSMPIGTDGVFVLVEETVTITGGTGRFAEVTGGFTTVRLVNRVNLTTAGYFDGTISRPNGK